MNKQKPENENLIKKTIKWHKHILMAFYIIFIGFCLAGIWIKWNSLNFTFEQQTKTILAYEEGFDSLSVTVTLPNIAKKPSFLERLTKLTQRKATPTPKPLRNINASNAWQKYAAHDVLIPDNNAQVILVIDDLGIVKDISKQIIDMPVPLTLSFLPYASNINAQVNAAYDKGHDILVHIPMEPKGRADPGPHALLSSSSPQAQMDSINYNLSQFSHYIGINNHMGSRFTEDHEAVDRLLNVIKDKGLMVLDSKTTSKSLLEKMAYQKNIPVTNRDVFLDNEQNVDYILGQLKILEQVAKTNGTAIAIGHPYAQTVAALKKWIPTLKEKGITIVPISQIIRQKYSDILLAAK